MRRTSAPNHRIAIPLFRKMVPVLGNAWLVERYTVPFARWIIPMQRTAQNDLVIIVWDGVGFQIPAE